MRDALPTWIFFAGAGQLCVLVASALVPIRLNWRTEFAKLPRLHRQMVWVYGGYVVLSIIAFGVVYNAARISLSERSRELASLRVLGLTRGEISYILLGELAVLTLLAVPWGLLIGYGLSAAFIAFGQDTELFRIPLVVYRSTFALAATTVIVAAIVSGLVVRRRLDHLDLVAVLRTRE